MTHTYLATGCLHGRHEYCQYGGEGKRPAQCKFCAAPCICPCHKANKENDMSADDELAQVAYEAYGAATEYKNFRGDPMPSWADLGETIQGAWRAAAQAVAECCLDD